MNCSHCSTVDCQWLARGPADLAALVGVVRAAVAEGVLAIAATPAKLALRGQPSFAELDLAQPWPDVLQYWFECGSCGRQYELSVDTYHGSSAAWRPIRDGKEG